MNKLIISNDHPVNSGSILKKANQQYRVGNYQAALEIYMEAVRLNVAPAKVIEFNIRQCQERIARDNRELHSKDIKDAISTTESAVQFETLNDVHSAPAERIEVTVTLTTISSRLPKIRRVLESLHSQTVPPRKILLNISKAPYLLDEGVSLDDPHLKSLEDLPLLEVNWVENTGPYRKIWYFLEQHFGNTTTTDKLFITVDDDTIYPDHFIQTLVEEYNKHDCIVAFRGRHMSLTEQEVSPYATWDIGANIATLNNLPTGKDGVLYSTKFFTPDFLDLATALEVAPTTDDLWIRWHCAANGIPAIILNPEACTSDYKSFPVVDYSKEYRGVSLYATHNSSASKGKNDLAVKALEQYYLKKFGYNVAMLLSGMR